jgi:hypothetical protein
VDGDSKHKEHATAIALAPKIAPVLAPVLNPGAGACQRIG